MALQAKSQLFASKLSCCCDLKCLSRDSGVSRSYGRNDYNDIFVLVAV